MNSYLNEVRGQLNQHFWCQKACFVAIIQVIIFPQYFMNSFFVRLCYFVFAVCVCICKKEIGRKTTSKMLAISSPGEKGTYGGINN